MTTLPTAAASRNTLSVYGRTYAPRVGSHVRLDLQPFGKLLLAGDDPCPGWGGCMFRWPNPVDTWRESRATACNITITGRTIRNGYIRVRIEWIGTELLDNHGDPSTYSGGWLQADSRSECLDGGAS